MIPFKHVVLKTLILRSIIAAGMIATAALGLASETLPIVDTHVHYNAEARALVDVRTVLEKLGDAEVSRAFVSSTPDDATLALYQADRRRIVPILRPYRSPSDRANWWQDDAVLGYLLTRLKSDVYRGIGEFHLWSPEQVKTAQIERLLREAVHRRLIVHVHSDAELLHALYSANPALQVLWAHAGMNAEPATIAHLLDRYPRLWVEVSLRAHDIAPNGELNPAWRSIFLRYPDRFMIGSDTWTTSRWFEYADIIAEHRAWLAGLPAEVAERIAFRNANSLISRHE